MFQGEFPDSERRDGTLIGTTVNNKIMKYHLTIYLSLLCNVVWLTAQSTITFILNDLPSEKPDNIGIRGSIPPLDWQKSIPLNRTTEGFAVTLEFPEATEPLEFKFVLYDDDQSVNWENIQNRTLSLVPDTDQTSINRWNREQVIDPATLEPISTAGLMADFELLKTMVLQVHPGTYRYNTEEQITKALQELKTAFSQPLTHGQAYLAISKLTAQIRCDHTKAGFNNQNKIINSVIHYQPDKLPFTFEWIGGEMIVLRNASENPSLTKGSSVLKINGVPVEQIYRKMIPYIGADGATDGNRRYKMEVNGYDFRYNAFDIFFPLLYPFEDRTLRLEVRPFGESAIKDLTVNSLTREDRAEILADRYPDFPRTRDDLWNFRMLDDEVALLTVNSFGLFGWKAMSLDYKQFLADTFEKLKRDQVEHLVIDIRENTGGADEMARELFHYLTADSYRFEREGRTRYLKFPESLKPYIQTWGDNPWYYDLNPKQKKPTDGYYIFPENFKSKESREDKEVYPGKVYLLTSSANTSLAYYTARRFQAQELGPIIGQETGGNLNDINGGQILFLRLPNSNIEVDFPVMGGFSTEPQPDSGVQPDVRTSYEVADLVQDRDVELEAVLKMIRK